jgi:hypothetical protein
MRLTNSFYILSLDYQRYENRDRILRNRLLFDRSIQNSKVSTTVEREQPHTIK